MTSIAFPNTSTAFEPKYNANIDDYSHDEYGTSYEITFTGTSGGRIKIQVICYLSATETKRCLYIVCIVMMRFV